jgi:cell division septum initiation protein DivIVA
MALSNAERQRRYIQRLKARAQASVTNEPVTNAPKSGLRNQVDYMRGLTLEQQRDELYGLAKALGLSPADFIDGFISLDRSAKPTKPKHEAVTNAARIKELEAELAKAKETNADLRHHLSEAEAKADSIRRNDDVRVEYRVEYGTKAVPRYRVEYGNRLPFELRERLAKICGMFGSDHAGERASAAKQANDLLRRDDSNWLHVLGLAKKRMPGDLPDASELWAQRMRHEAEQKAKRAAAKARREQAKREQR